MLNRLLCTFLIISTVVHADWSEYKSLYIAEDGRVIDRVNCDTTHSESIGYALYLALENSDLNTFKKVHTWYTNNLKKNEFNLIGWKWGKDKDGSWHTLDFNNASDGDLWIAYDNLLMYEKSNEQKYKQEALSLMQSIKKYLIVEQNGSLYLLPGHKGFIHNDTIEINLSYYLFFIFDKFQKYDKDTIWSRLSQDGVKLLYNSRFSPLELNADWVEISKNSSSIKPAKNSSFGYDALRIPFNILKSDIEEKERLLAPYINYVNGMKAAKSIFGVVDLKDGNISLYNYSYAQLSIYNLIDQYYNKQKSFSKKIIQLKGEKKDDYYSYSIYLLSRSL